MTRQAIAATRHCLTGCAIGEVLGMVIGTLAGTGQHRHRSSCRSRWPSVFGYALTMRGVLRAGRGPPGGGASRAGRRHGVDRRHGDHGQRAWSSPCPGRWTPGLSDALFWARLAVSLVDRVRGHRPGQPRADRPRPGPCHGPRRARARDGRGVRRRTCRTPRALSGSWFECVCASVLVRRRGRCGPRSRGLVLNWP